MSAKMTGFRVPPIKKQKAVNEVREKLRIELGRVPFMEEIADALNMSINEYRKMLAENSVNTIQSLDAHLEENGDSDFSATTLSKLPDPEKEAEKKELAKNWTKHWKTFGKGAPGHSVILLRRIIVY